MRLVSFRTRASLRRASLSLCGLLAMHACSFSAAQDKTKPSGPAVFAGYDVTTVKLNKSGNGGMSWSTDDTSMRATNVTLKMLIASATGVREQLITGLPAWAGSEHFDIQAKIVDPDPALKTRKQTREEAQAEFQAQITSVLQERFHLKTHKETKIQPVFDLVLAKGGSKLKPHDKAGPGGSINWNNGVLTATDIEVKDFVRSIEYEAGRTVVDKTGLSGSYDLQLKWTREAQNVNATDNGSGDRPPDLLTALQDQLGLKLVSDKGPVESVVVDSIDQPTLD